MVFSLFSPVHLAAEGHLFAELLGEHADGLAAYDAKTRYRYAHSEIVWQSREITSYRHVFHGPEGERTVFTHHTRGVDDLGGLTAAPAHTPQRREAFAGVGTRYEVQAGVEHGASSPLPVPRTPPVPRTLLLVLLALSFASAACSPPVAASSDRLVSSFTASPSFNNFREPCRVAYTLAQPARVSLRVTRGPGDERVLVATLAQDQKEPRGRRTADWRGVGADGRFVPQGLYHVELVATPATGGAPVAFALPAYLYRE